MKNKSHLKTINWFIFGLLISIGVITAIITLLDLNNLNDTTQSLDGRQSRAEFRWSSMHTAMTVVLLILSTFLAIGWKRLFPFNVPIALIIAGFYYELFFLTFTVGWVGIQGMIGLLLALLTGVILIISHSVFIFIKRKKAIKS
ncbi:hypothetical protein HNQ85_000081 [Anoxybacillus calidus]|jgi:hypothetical protein|uniref:RND transporter n=1 Tax=[Anoxybacillus] calidus TaxID=575178 RepID=A0A7V9YWP9_9BACL|nr:RND transporter [Anoxybacillus calidus]MBA2869823.1 hypothetical protein [Anoxybacillus calidus]